MSQYHANEPNTNLSCTAHLSDLEARRLLRVHLHCRHLLERYKGSDVKQRSNLKDSSNLLRLGELARALETVTLPREGAYFFLAPSSPLLLFADLSHLLRLTETTTKVSSDMSRINFAPYQPPPDERILSQSNSAPSTSRAPASVPSVPRTAAPQSPPQESLSRASIESDIDPRYATESYQSSYTNGPSYSKQSPAISSYNQQSFQSAPVWAQKQQQPPLNSAAQRPHPQSSRTDHLSYSTAHGWNLSNLCFAAWSLPPFSSVLLLIFETENVSL